MTDRTVVLVSRQWDSPSISVTITDQAIGLAMPLADFLRVLVREHGPVWSTLTQAGLLADLTTAAEVVISGIKAESVHAPLVPPDEVR